MNDSEREMQLDEILAAYLEAASAGWAPDREHLLRCYPHLADELSRFFAGQDAVEGAAAAVRGEAPRPILTLAEAVMLPPTPAPPATDEDGPQVPGYAITGELGRGAMGVVYKARHLTLNRTVALKMMLAGAHAGESDHARFRSEATAIARLNHPNIVQIYEIGEYGGIPYLALEFCEGGSLEDKLGGTPLPPREAARLVATVARAMQAAHDKGVIHRDLKPANVMLAEDATLKITDFGLAKLEQPPLLTACGAILGTPSYMAPEQAGGKTEQIGRPADVYALGAILYECLTGRPPFKGPTALDTIMQVIADEPVPPRQLQSKTPRDLETVCLKCLQKEPHKRYASAVALAEELERFGRGEPVRARPLRAFGRALRWARRRPRAAVLVALTGLGVLGLLGMAGKLEIDREKAALFEKSTFEREAWSQRLEIDVRVQETLSGVRRCAAEGVNQPVREQQFRHSAFGAILHRGNDHREIREWQWVPGVEDRDRDSFEEKMRAEGHAGFEIRDLTLGGQTIRASRRQKYFPVQYAVAYTKAGEFPTPILGIDQSADVHSNAAMERAKEGQKDIKVGQPPLFLATTAWTTLPDGQILFRAFCPIYRDGSRIPEKDPAGFIVAVIDVRDMIGGSNIDNKEFFRLNLTYDMTLRVSDEDRSAGPPLDFVLRGQPRLSTAHLESMKPYVITVADSKWRLEFRPLQD